MNRWDEIFGTARDVADWTATDPAQRDLMAADLIKLVGLMVQAVGKGVAIDGESSMDDPDDATAYARYLVGEAVQRAAREAVAESVAADIERYERNNLAAGWTSRRVQQRDGESSFVQPSETVPAGSCGTLQDPNRGPCGTCPDCRSVGFVQRPWPVRKTCCRRDATRCPACRNGGPVLDCCFPIPGVCPTHH